MRDSPRERLRENGTVLLPTGAWFLAALLAEFVAQLWDQFVRFGLFSSLADPLAFALSTTGVLTVLLYAIAVGRSRVRDGAVSGE